MKNSELLPLMKEQVDNWKRMNSYMRWQGTVLLFIFMSVIFSVSILIWR